MTDPTVVRATILGFVADHPATFGRNRAARILAGRITEEDIDRAPTLPVIGPLAGMKRAEVLETIDALIEAEVIAKSHGDRPRITLTRRGWGYLAAIELLTTTKEKVEA